RRPGRCNAAPFRGAGPARFSANAGVGAEIMRETDAHAVRWEGAGLLPGILSTVGGGGVFRRRLSFPQGRAVENAGHPRPFRRPVPLWPQWERDYMRNYILRRLLQLIPVLLGISIAIFAVLR